MLNNKEILLSWSSFPAIERPKTTFLLVVFLTFLSAVIWRITIISWEMPLFFYLGLSLVCFNLIPYFINTRYYLLSDKIVIYYSFFKIERKYDEFRCFYSDKKGILLGTFRRPNRLDRFRGQSLRFSQTQEEKTNLVNLLLEKVGNKY